MTALGCYWASVETEPLTMGHQVTMQPELIVVIWVSSDPSSHKEGRAQQHSMASKLKRYRCDQAQAGPEDTRKLHEEVAQMPMISTPATVLSASKHAPVASWAVPYG